MVETKLNVTMNRLYLHPRWKSKDREVHELVHNISISWSEMKTATHSVFIDPSQTYVCKVYDDWERERCYKNLLAFHLCGQCVVPFISLYESKEKLVLVSLYIAQSDSDGLKQCLSSLFDLHTCLRKKQSFTIVTENGDKHYTQLECIDYTVEFYRRIIKSRSTDINHRFEQFGREIVESLEEVYISLFSHYTPCHIVHGDAKRDNMASNCWLDFDHLRIGRQEYDIGRVLAWDISFPFNSVLPLIASLPEAYSQSDVWKNYFHHTLVLVAQSLAKNKRSNFEIALDKLVLIQRELGLGFNFNDLFNTQNLFKK